MRSPVAGALALVAGAALLVCQTPPAAAPKKTALDKVTFEAYVRHLFVWGTPIQVKVDDPKPSPLDGFVLVKVTAAAGNASQEETFYVSKDGQKIVRGAVFDVTGNPFQPDLDKLKTQFEPSYGTPGAPVVLVVFSDFQCPYCREEAKMLRENLLSAYPKQVRVYFKDFPLDAIHPWARAASIAGRCVFRQNAASFWEYHDWMFDKQAEMTPDNLKAKVLEFAAGKKLDTLELGRCMDSRATETDVSRTSAEARALGVNSLPTVFVNGRRIAAQIAWPNLRQIIDFELEYQKTAKNAGEEACCEVKLPSPLGN
ncbi:MAG: thioredoxin domain-containing protein [Acidobacteria bacterium]|nr:thioredoxin domain-containing protein [Acidobacteriota bacterium]